MSLEEKVGQLGIFADMLRPFVPGINPEMNEHDAAQTLELVRSGRAGALFNGVGAALGREAQRVAVEETRLGIPLLFGADVIHGMRTVFPIPLGEAASFETVDAEVKEFEGIQVRVATPAALYRLKKGTVRPLDRRDAEALRRRFDLSEE